MKKIWQVAAAGALAAAVLAPTIGTASAGGGGDWRWKRHYHGHGWNPGPAILGGAVLGLTLGALANPHYYPPPPPVYYAPYPSPPYPAGYYDEDPHIAWCSATYRSYNAETDTWVGYDGLIHRCVEPY
jgi:hypothetical protein